MFRSIKSGDKLNWKKIVISTFATGLVLLVLWFAWSAIVPIVFPNYDPTTLPGMRAAENPLMPLFFLYFFVLALAFAIAFHFFEDTFANMAPSKRGFYFGLVMWMLVTLPGMFLVYTSMTYSETFLLTNTIQQLVNFSIAGIVISNIFAQN